MMKVKDYEVFSEKKDTINDITVLQSDELNSNIEPNFKW